jgi:hypothetical protein
MRKPSSLCPIALHFSLLLLISIFLLPACGNDFIAPPAEQESTSVIPTLPATTINETVQITPPATPEATSTIPTSTPNGIDEIVPIDQNIFLSQLCPLSFTFFNGWSAQEFSPGEPGSISMEAPTIELIKDQYRLAILCFVKDGENMISPGGRGAGDYVDLPETQFLDKFISGQATVWEGAMVSVLYAYQSEVLTVFVDLGPNPYSTNTVPYQEFDITEEIVTEVAKFLTTFSLTEVLEIPIPNSTTDDPLVILPMDDFYHSQLDDTDLPNACAPTAGFIVLDYLKRETSLDAVADLLMMEKPEHGGYDPSCERNVVCTSPMTLAQRLSYEYHLTIHTRQGWTLNAVYNALNRGHPIIADILWRTDGQGLGHFVVIFGVDKEEKLIYYHDPIEGESIVSTWQVFSERWSGPVDVGDPTYPQGFQYWGMEVYSDEWGLISTR